VRVACTAAVTATCQSNLDVLTTRKSACSLLLTIPRRQDQQSNRRDDKIRCSRENIDARMEVLFASNEQHAATTWSSANPYEQLL